MDEGIQLCLESGETELLGILYELLGKARIRQSDYAGAAEDFRAALKADPNRVEALYYLTILAIETNDEAEAEENLEALERLDPRSARLLCARAYRQVLRTIRGAEGWKEALLLLETAERRDPQFPDVYLVRANLYGQGVGLAIDHGVNPRGQEYSDIDEALRNLDVAIELDPLLVSALTARALNLMRLGRTREALRDLERSVKIAPELSRSHYLLAKARKFEGDAAGAIAAIRQAIRISPKRLRESS